MSDKERYTKLFESLLNDVKEIRVALMEDATENNYLVSKINFLEGRIEGAKIALEWTQKEKK